LSGKSGKVGENLGVWLGIVLKWEVLGVEEFEVVYPKRRKEDFGGNRKIRWGLSSAVCMMPSV
jgi:hypothetical protein